MIEEKDGVDENEKDGIDECIRCRKEVTQNSKAIQCDVCYGWYHSHQRCGRELEKVHDILNQLELIEEKVRDSKKGIDDNEEQKSLEWVCTECQEKRKRWEELMEERTQIIEEYKIVMCENKNEIVQIKNEIK